MARVLGNLSCSLLTIPLLITTVQQLLSLFARFKLDDPVLNSVIKKLLDCTTKIQQFFDRNRTSIYTTPIKDKYRVRGSIYHGFFCIILSKSRLPESTEREAAKQLMTILGNYGSEVYKEGYAEQTFHIGALLEDLKKPEFAAALQLTNTTHNIKDLTTAHIEFQAIYDQKIINDANETGPVIVEQKNYLTYYLSSLLSYIDLSIDLDIGPFKPVIYELNVILTNAMTTFHATQTRLANEEDGTADTKENAPELAGPQLSGK